MQNAILALSVTREWSLCLTLFDNLKKHHNPSSVCYSAMIAGALLNEDEFLASDLLNEMCGMFLRKQKRFKLVTPFFFNKTSASISAP